MYINKVGASDISITIIPGGPSLPGYLHGLRDLLCPSFQVNEIDLRDSSISPAGPPFSIEGCFEDIAEALRHGARTNILLGHSAGALLSLA